MTLYFIIGVDQDGDATWDVTTSLDDALYLQKQMAGLCHEPPILWQVETDPAENTVVDTTKLKI